MRETERNLNYSAIVSVYAKEDPGLFARALESVWAQTVPPDDFILMCDGPLTPELDQVIEDALIAGIPLRVCRLEVNMGLPVVLEQALRLCRNDLVLRLGSDDVCVPERAAILLEEFRKNPDLAVVGGYMQAFHEHPGDSPLIREVPLSHEEILELARRRNPFDDATTMYKKSVVEAVGGYDPKMARAQDYDLYARILAAGYETKNIPMVLCYFHEDAIALKRRLGARQLSCFIRVRWRVFRLGLGNFIDFLVPCLAQLVISAVPAKVAMKLYDKRLRADVSAVEARHEN